MPSRTVRIAIGFVFVIGLVSAHARPATAQQMCQVSDESTEQVLPGVTLTYTSSFLCADAPDEGSYTFTVTVANAAESTEAVTISDLTLQQTTPRPRGQGPDASGTAAGLPISVAPGETESFTVSGNYELVATDEGNKANLHFQASGQGTQSGSPFDLGINAFFRGAGAAEAGDDNGGPSDDPPNGGPGDDRGGGRPPWVPGPPPWADEREDD